MKAPQAVCAFLSSSSISLGRQPDVTNLITGHTVLRTGELRARRCFTSISSHQESAQPASGTVGLVPRTNSAPDSEIGSSRRPSLMSLAILILGEIVLGLLSFPLARCTGSGVHPLQLAHWSDFGRGLKLGAGLTLPVLILHKVSGKTIDCMLKESLDELFGGLLQRKIPLVLLFAILSLSAGMSEELLFRGTLQPILTATVCKQNVDFAIMASSLLFGVLHGATVRYFLLATILSVYVGYVLHLTQSLMACMVLHTIFDFIGFVQYARLRKARKGR